jgi:hypothetical protein
MKYLYVSLLVMIKLGAMEGSCARLIELATIVSARDANRATSEISNNAAVVSDAPSEEYLPAAADESLHLGATRKRKSYPNSPVVELYGYAFELIRNPKPLRTKYLCITCDRVVSNLEPHALCHAGLKPYTCECGKSYRQSAHLAGHRKKACPLVPGNFKKSMAAKKT